MENYHNKESEAALILEVIDCLEAAEAAKSTIADDYETAQRMAFAFAARFEDTGRGRKLYDRYCRLSAKYSEEWATEQYDKALKTLQDVQKAAMIGNFFQLCHDNGITVE